MGGLDAYSGHYCAGHTIYQEDFYEAVEAHDCRFTAPAFLTRTLLKHYCASRPSYEFLCIRNLFSCDLSTSFPLA